MLFNKFKFTFLIILIILIFENNLFSQILINEYYNTSSNQNEWIELIVTENNSNLIGYEISDALINNNEPNNFNGGVRFNNITYWSNIPKGTFIVIYLKDVDNSLLDFDLIDGKIILEATDATYFTKVCSSCNINNWESEAFVIEDEAELFTIRNNNNNIHSIGHSSSGVGFFNQNWGTLLKTSLGNNRLISVLPGNALITYFGGFDENEDYLLNNNFSTLGSANRASFGEITNYQFIDFLRIPEWTGIGNLTINEIGSQFNLRWNKVLNTPDNSDYYTFLVLLTVGNITQNDLPKNGTKYLVDDVIGNSRVVAKIDGNIDGNININPSLNCGSEYTVSIILGRFKSQNSFNSFSSNGISYNIDDYPKGKISRKAVEFFELVTPGNQRVFCVDKDTTLTLSTDISDPNVHKFTWYKDGLIFKSGGNFGENQTLDINESGNYFCQLSNSDGCFRNSPLLNIQINEKPQVIIKYNNKIISSDTTFIICKNDEIEITSETQNGFVEWYKIENNQFVKILNSGLNVIRNKGKYFSLATNGECYDTSNIVEVIVEDYTFSIDKSKLEFYKLLNIDVSNFIKLTNNSDRFLTFNKNDITLELPFNFKSVTFPITLNPGETKDIEINLDTDSFESKDYKLTFRNGCNTFEEVILNAFRINDEIIVEPRKIDFGRFLNCDFNKIDTLINIFNNTENTIEIDANVKAPFLINSSLPISINKQEEFDLSISFDSNINGIYADSLTLYFNKGSEIDSLKIELKAYIYEPILDIQPNNIDLGVLSECIDFKDTTIKLINQSETDIVISKQFSSDVSFINLPINIPSYDSIEVPIRISTLIEGVFNYSTSFEYLPCEKELELNIDGIKSKIDYIFDDRNIDFDTIRLCNNEDQKILNSRLKIESDNPLYSYIDSISVPMHFKTNLQIGKELFNSNNFSVTFTPDDFGYYSEYIYLRYFPCGKIDSILFTGFYSDISFDAPDTIYFPIVKVNEKSLISFDIQNKSLENYDLTVSSISNPNINYLGQSTISFNNSDLYKLDFEFISSEPIKDTLELLLNVDSPCSISKKVILIAESVPKDLIDIYFTLPNDLTHNANDILTFNLNINSNFYDLDTLNIRDVILKFDLNTFVLDLNSISGYEPSTIDVTFDIKNNLLELKIDKLIEKSMVFEFRPLIGNDFQTEFSLIDVSYNYDKELTIYGDSLFVTLNGICDLEDRLFYYGDNSTFLKVFQDDYDDVNIEYNVVNKEELHLEIFSLIGNKVYSIDIECPSLGRYSLDLPKLGSGIYLINFKNGLIEEKSKFIIKN